METARTKPESVALPPARLAGLSLGQWKLAVLAGVLAVALLLPAVTSGFTLFQVTLALIYAIALLGLNLLIGFNGQFSLGHSAFLALGGYTAAVMMNHFQIPYGWTIPVSGAVCFVVGFLFGIPALRIQGVYLALATLALALATPPLLKYKYFESWTGGVQGIVLKKPGAPWGLPLDSDQWLYYLTLAVMLLGFLLAWNLINSRTGRAMMAIRDHHTAAEAMGINTALYKTLTFGVSAMYTGIAGALNAIVVSFVAPDSYQLILSIYLLVGVVVGGLASLGGAVFGAFFIQYVPNIAGDISKAAPWAIFGLFMIVFMFIMPAGIYGTIRIGWLRWVLPRLLGGGAADGENKENGETQPKP